MSRKVLRGANFAAVSALNAAVEKYIAAYNKGARPFLWKKRGVVASQIKDTIAILCK